MVKFRGIPAWVLGASLVACGSNETSGDAPASGGSGATTSTSAGGNGNGNGNGGASTSAGGGGSTSGSAGTTTTDATTTDATLTTTAGGTGGTPVEGQHCEGGIVVGESAFFDGVATNCYEDRLEYDLPNPVDASIRSLTLPTPLEADIASAISLEISGGGPVEVELWGTDGECGAAKELLWRNDLSARIHCAAFTPTTSHSHVLLVTRQFDDSNYLFQITGIGLCSGGSCPEPNGTGVGAGETLTATQRAYLFGGGGLYKGYAATLGVWGRIYMLGDNSPSEGETMDIATGLFKAPTPFEPYGDAYYCIGAGSTVTRNADDEGFEVSLRNITRLGSCEEISGDGTLTLTRTSGDSELTSTLEPLNFIDDIVNGSCSGTECEWSLSDAPKFVWIDYWAAEDLGNWSEPTLVESAITQAAVFHQLDDDAPLELACGSSGTTYYDHDGTTTLQVDNLSDFARCPGEAIADDSYDFHMY